MLLKGKNKTLETSEQNSVHDNVPARTKKEKNPTVSDKPKQISKSKRKLLAKDETQKRKSQPTRTDFNRELFDRYEELATQTDKYQKVIRFRRDAGVFSQGCWKTHYGKVDLENSSKYGFLGETLKTDPLVRNLGKGNEYCSPFGWTQKFEIEFDELKKSLEVGMFDDPIYTGMFSPLSLDFLLKNHSKELEELFTSETQAKYEYIVRLVGSIDFAHIKSSSFDKIIKRFPSRDSLAKASISKISEIEGISRATATTVKERVEDVYNI